MDIVEFLTARENERERIALVALSCTEDGTHDAVGWFVADQQVVGDDGTEDGMTVAHARWDDPGILDHIAANDPAWVLADVAAKRAVVAVLRDNPALVDGAGEYYDDVMRALSQPYADHPDFDPSWRVETSVR